MKKSLLALAVLGGFVGVASAQSSVTLFGTVDLSGTYVKNDGHDRRLSLSKDGINSSQLGFRGVEDLGGGLKASFMLLTAVSADTGSAGTDPGYSVDSKTGKVITDTAAKFFNRRSTVSLSGGFGEVRLGRDYTPSFWNQTIFDAFGTNGLGSSINVAQLYGGTRMDNSVGYFLPTNLGGFYGQAMMAAGESGTSQDKRGRYLGARLGFASGPFDVAIAAGQQRNAFATTAAAATTDTQKTYNIGASWNFGGFKLMGYVDRDDAPNLKENRYNISTVIPLGQSEVHLGYDRSKFTNNATAGANYSNTVWQAAATYQYNLSKRTALYATVSHLNNGANSTKSVGAAPAPISSQGGKSNGAQFGVRHFF